MTKQKRISSSCDDSSSSSSSWSAEELEISQLLVVLPHHKWYLLSQIPYNWLCRKKRSTPQDNTTTIQSPSPSSSQPHQGGGAVVKEKASSPNTPLSFPATESDEKIEHSQKKTKTSLKRKREHYLQIIQDLTKTKADLNQEIENVKRHCDQLKAYNLKLKEREQQLCNNGTKSECKNLNLEIGQQVNGSVNTSISTAEIEHQKQRPQMPTVINQNLGSVQFRYVSGHPTTSFPIASSCKGPLLPIPDLNLSIEELSNVDSCEPSDETMAKKDFSRAMAAQARQRRLQIFRHKNPVGGNNNNNNNNGKFPRQSYR